MEIILLTISPGAGIQSVELMVTGFLNMIRTIMVLTMIIIMMQPVLLLMMATMLQLFLVIPGLKVLLPPPLFIPKGCCWTQAAA